MDALQAAGKKAEDGFNEVLGSIGSIFGGPQRIGRSMSLDSSDIGAYAPLPPPQKKTPPPNLVPPPWPGPDGDTVMRLHCAALERLVMMGLSPQAARVSLRHLDAWMVSETGVKEMRAAEEVAEATGEPLLHLGAHIKLSGLVKNPAANGKVGTLYAYRAEDQRWKVVLAEGRTYWLQAKFIRLLEEKKVERISGEPGLDEALPTPSAPDLAVAWAKLDAGQKALKENHEAQQIQLLERQEFLHQYQEQLDAQSQGLIERRKSIAMDQAKGFQALDQATTTIPEPSPRKLAFVISEPGAFADSNVACEDEEGDGADSPPELDEVWDTDWAAVAALSGAKVAGVSCSTTASPTSDPNVSPPQEPPRAAARLVQMQAASPLDQELLQRKLQEKRDLAEEHSGEDHATESRALPERPHIPGAHLDLAEKLEEKRRHLEVDESMKADDGI